MFAVPVLTPTATPELGDTVPMVATAVLPEVQVTRELMLCVDESLKVPTAENPMRPPIGMVCAVGATAMDTIVAFVTVNGTVAVSEPSVAVTFACPAPIALANPLLALIVSAAVLSEDQ